VALVVANVWFTAWTMAEMMGFDSAADWAQFIAAGRHGIEPGLYDLTYRWSPLMVPVLGALAPLGLGLWRLLHVVAALAMPTWPMRLFLLAAWPFWFDVSLGNVMTFVLLAAAWALRGSRVAGLAFLAMMLLIPRPLMLPVAAWLLWRQPELRIPFAVGAVVIGALTLATGLADEWIRVLISSTNEIEWMFNVGPSRWIGAAWLIVGIPLAVWLTWRGRVGFASLTVSPYWLPYYLMMPLLELIPRHGNSRQSTAH
jgi:hypothetical protein